MMSQKRKMFSNDQIKTLIERTNVSYVIVHDMCVYDVTGLMAMIVIRGTHSGMTIPLPPSSHEFAEVAAYIQNPDIQHVLEEVDPDYSEQLERSRSMRVTQQRNVAKRRMRGRKTARTTNTQISLDDIIRTYLDKKIDMMPYGMHVAIKELGKHLKPRRTAENFLRF